MNVSATVGRFLLGLRQVNRLDKAGANYGVEWEGLKHNNESLDYVSKTLLAIALAISLYALLVNLAGPLTDAFGFRQTQTAITSYYIAQGGAILAYETPVLGAPWAIPFEFPTMQILAALLNKAGVPLDAAGRIISYAFLLGCLWPIRLLFRAANLPTSAFWIASVLFIASPLHLFWGRTFLIETTALFFSLLWLAIFVRLLSSPRTLPTLIATSAVVGSVAALTKSTTFIAVVLFAFLWFVRPVVASLVARDFKSAFRLAAVAGGVTFVPLAIGQGWVVWTDSIKSTNQIGAYLTSQALASWNFGSLDQRFSASFWKVFIERMLPDIFGLVPLLSLGLLAIHLIVRGHRWFIACCLFAFLGTLMILTNLHQIHSYYQVSIAVFAILAVALAISKIGQHSIVGASAVMALVFALQIGHFSGDLHAVLAQDNTKNPHYQAGLAAKRHTDPSDVLLVIGHDWDSTIPYYSERKSLAIPSWMPDESYKDAYSRIDQFGAVVVCKDGSNQIDPAIFAAEQGGMVEVESVGICGIYRKP